MSSLSLSLDPAGCPSWVFLLNYQEIFVFKLRKKKAFTRNVLELSSWADMILPPSLSPVHCDQDFNFTIHGGEMGALIRNHNWSHSPLGLPNSWPQSLKTALSICLGSKFPMVIWWGPDFIVFYNDAYIPIAGRKHPMFLGRRAQEKWPEIWDVVGSLANHVVSTGEATFSEDQPLFMERKGVPEELYFTFSFSPARDESGAVGGMFCAVQEMTSRVIGERRLRVLRELGDQESQTENEVGTAAVDILSKSLNDTPFCLLYVTDENEQSASLLGSFGLTSAGIGNQSKLDLVNFSKNFWPIENAFTNKKATRVDSLRSHIPAELPKIPYDEMPDSAFIMPIETVGKATPAGFLIMGINPRLEFEESYQGFFALVLKQITSQFSNVRILNEQKKRLQAMAEVDQAKTAFFSNVSHEFRTPLTLIIGPIEDILSGSQGKLNLGLQAEVEVIHRNSLRLLKLVNTLLDFSRIEAGRMQAQFVETDLAAMTRNIASTFRSTLERAHLRFIVEIGEVPGALFVDADMWEKIVLNLLSNAYKYTLKGQIKIKLESLGNEVELSVCDTGQGIPETELPKIFQRFHRVEGAHGRTHEGTGIGLSLVLELVKLHGGTLRVESKAGLGSTFFVRIPKGSQHLPEESIAHPDADREENINYSKIFSEEAQNWDLQEDTPLKHDDAIKGNQTTSLKKRIIVADDNSDMRNYISTLLQDHYEVLGVSDGKKALEAAKLYLPDLILSDIMMPGMDGIEFLKALRLDHTINTIPVILLSARAGEEARTSGIETGADDYLTKPFSAKELLARVRTQLHMSTVRQNAVEKDALLIHLGRQRKWLESILDLVPTPLFLMEAGTGKIIFANQASHAMSGGRFPLNTPVEEYARNYEVSDSDGKKLSIDEFPAAQAARGIKQISREVVWHTSSGQFTLLVDSEQVPSAESGAPLIILCLRDVSEMKRTQVELKRSVRARDEFLSLASHELNTPLTSLRLQTQLMMRELAKGISNAISPSKVKRLIELADKQVTRLAHLVENMLDISRIERGDLNLAPTPFDLTVLVKEVIERLSPQFQECGSLISVDSPENIAGNWDRFRIDQVLTNLMTNACRYGLGKPIHVLISQSEGWIVTAVRDCGKGIALEDQKRIFDRFERAISYNEVSGLGLGLYIANQIMRAHGGTLEVESKLGEGTVFSMKLPMTRAGSSAD